MAAVISELSKVTSVSADLAFDDPSILDFVFQKDTKVSQT